MAKGWSLRALVTTILPGRVNAFTAMPPLGLGRRTFRLGVDPLAGQASCRTSTTGMEVSAALVLPSGLVGVRTYAAAVRVHSFVVFTR